MQMNEQKLHKKTRWNTEAAVPGDIHQFFDKKPEKKRIEYEVLNLLNEEKKAAFLEYIRKSFDICQNAKDQQQMYQMLLASMNELIQNKEIDTVNWEKFPIPIIKHDQNNTQSAVNNPLNSFNTISIPGYTLPNTNSTKSNNSQQSTQLQPQQQNQQQLASTTFSFTNKDQFQQQQDLKTSSSSKQASFPSSQFAQYPSNSQSSSSSSILPFSINTQPSIMNFASSLQQNSFNYNNQNNNNNNNNHQHFNQQFNQQQHFLEASNLNKLTSKDKKQIKFDNKVALKLQQQEQQIVIQPQLQLSMAAQDNEPDFDQLLTTMNIVGTCTEIEKPYLRLTKIPSPDQVRPEETLKKSLKMLMNKWKNKDCEYSYIQSQFRSIRQDLVIQHIRNEFTAKVCETNARICLEVDDHAQYVQCCSTLFELYQIGIKGEREEFYCYKIIDAGLSISKPSLELPKLVYEVSTFIDHPLIEFALELLHAHSLNNFYKFFQMYEKSPNMCYCIIEKKITKLRAWALTVLSKSIQSKFSLEDIQTLLKFEDFNHAKEFVQSVGIQIILFLLHDYPICELGGILDESKKDVLLKESHKAFADAYQKI